MQVVYIVELATIGYVYEKINIIYLYIKIKRQDKDLKKVFKFF